VSPGLQSGVRLPLLSRADCVGLGLSARSSALACGWPERDAAEISLLVIELTTNAVRHAGGGHCVLSVSSRELRVEVEDEGPGFPQWAREGTAPDAPPEPRTRGLGAGLACARRLSHLLRLENRQPCGARAVAARYRMKDRTVEEKP
jgi:anti-sigma regulatory factor (Ser/Thr protein kinase)